MFEITNEAFLNAVAGGDDDSGDDFSSGSDGSSKNVLSPTGSGGGSDGGGIQTVTITGDLDALKRNDAAAQASCSVIGFGVGWTVTVLAVEAGPMARIIGSAAGSGVTKLCKDYIDNQNRDEKLEANKETP